MPNEQQIREALKAVKYPGYTRDIVSFGLVKQVAIRDGAVSVVVHLTGGSPDVAKQIKTDSEMPQRAAVRRNYREQFSEHQPVWRLMNQNFSTGTPSVRRSSSATTTGA